MATFCLWGAEEIKDSGFKKVFFLNLLLKAKCCFEELLKCLSSWFHVKHNSRKRFLDVWRYQRSDTGCAGLSVTTRGHTAGASQQRPGSIVEHTCTKEIPRQGSIATTDWSTEQSGGKGVTSSPTITTTYCLLLLGCLPEYN